MRRPADWAILRRPRRWWTNASLMTKALTVVAIPITMLVFSVAASLVLLQVETSARNQATQANNGYNVVQGTLTDLLNIETSVRGYAVTGDQIFLQPFYAAIRDIPASLRGAATLSGDPAAAAAERQVQIAGANAFAQLSTIKSQIDTGNQNSAQITAEMIRGKQYMDQARRALTILGTEQAATARTQTHSLAVEQDWSTAILVIELTVGVLGGLFGTLVLVNSIVRRVRLVRDNAKRFVSGQSLLPFPPSGDELGELADDVSAASAQLGERNVELAEARDHAVAATRAKDEFLSRMSHELRTPLTAILGFGQLLQMEELNEDNAESVDQIVRAGHHLLDLINEVLDIAKIESGHMELSLEPVHVREVAEESLRLMRPQAEGRHIIPSIIEEEPEVVALVDRQRLSQVLLNLISNGIKYNREGGQLTLAIQGTGDTVRIDVTDGGEGIDPDLRERVFAPFDRLNAGMSGIQGTGVGLSLSRALCEAMNGTLSFESTVGVGTTFTVNVPRATLEAVTGEQVALGPRVPTDPAAGVILYVEDNLANLRLIERVMRTRPETLQVALQGEICVELAREIHPKLILLDIHLPDISGDEVLRRLRADPDTADIAVVILSADVSPRRAQRLLDEGASDYLPKPIDVRRLVTILDRLKPPVAAVEKAEESASASADAGRP